VVIANHPDLADYVRPFGVPFIHIPATRAVLRHCEDRVISRDDQSVVF
ncbi:Formyltetrahydrofolate hydrolase, partial [Mycobacterium terramassiliense]